MMIGPFQMRPTCRIVPDLIIPTLSTAHACIKYALLKICDQNAIKEQKPLNFFFLSKNAHIRKIYFPNGTVASREITTRILQQ